ncbi:hypothetical protein [Salipiger mucosus]|uniref:Uncharacterized protein n=1 Tax=Salipiger mucosus DSM 16094 TaxID=1123237 RepID=S9RQX1_9RHOB|nr:hypothetical protein [Salipiger mucosus]EPX76404.1 hypothetical protein Salmuc_02906 [Salipiger mucosus DSM 16094]
MREAVESHGAPENRIAETWRVGFELEVVLGDLGNPRFSDFGPMDIATLEYCRTVAGVLSSATGETWTAPRKASRKTGFFVIPEYDIDPIAFPHSDQIAGVELVTPPMPLAEADDLRRHISDAIFDLDGSDNADRDAFTSDLGWHINIDPGNPNRELAADLFCVGVDEIDMLWRSRRLGRRYTGLQRHGYGPRLLRELQAPSPFMAADLNLANFLSDQAGASKRFAANFARDAYVELRHYGTPDFFGGVALAELIGEPIRAFQMDHTSAGASREHLLALFRILAGWLADNRSRLGFAPHEDSGTSLCFATLLFDNEEVGLFRWSGTATIELWGADRYQTIVGAWGQAQADLPEVFALLCLDLAELRAIEGAVAVKSAALVAAIGNLADRIEEAGLAARPAKVRGEWWAR